jgi:hypothetical protein
MRDRDLHEWLTQTSIVVVIPLTFGVCPLMSLDICGESRSLQTWLDLGPFHGGRAKLLGAASDLHSFGYRAFHAFPSSPYKENM